MSNTALVKLPDRAVGSVSEYDTCVSTMRERANFITPALRLDHIPPMHRVSLRAVAISPDPQRGDVYADRKFCQENERSLTKVGLLKIWQAAGGSVVESRRIDDQSDPLRVEWSCRVRVQQLDSRIVEFHATKEVDLRPGSPQAKAMKENQLAQQQQNIAALAESKALLRAVRGALALRQKYTIDELSRPFVVPALVPDLDTSDPEIRRMVAAKALGIENALFGAGPRALPPPPDVTTVEAPADPEPDDSWMADPDATEPEPPLPMNADVLASIDDAKRRGYLERMSRLATTLLERDASAGRAAIAGIVGATDLLTVTLGDLSVIGHQLASAVQGGAR